MYAYAVVARCKQDVAFLQGSRRNESAAPHGTGLFQRPSQPSIDSSDSVGVHARPQLITRPKVQSASCF